MSSTDRVSPELREVEKEIDNYYKSNPLLKLPFATAAWYLLSSAEEYMLIEQMGGVGRVQDIHNLGSDFITEIEHSMSWIYCECAQGGQITFAKDNNLYKASRDLFELGRKYDLFKFAYKCASDGVLELELQGSIIQPTGEFFTKIEYEAYNILIDSRQPEEAQFELNPHNFPMGAIQHSLKVKGDRFRYKLNPKMVADMKMYLEPLFDKMFILPSTWEFSCYTLGDFRKVFEVVCAISHIHWSARHVASNLGCEDKGYLDSFYVLTFDELLNRVIRYTGLSKEKVQNVLDDLTYGNRGIKRPVPALQPLIKLNSEYYAIVPNVWICSAAERNFISLINRFQPDKDIYDIYKNKKECLQKVRFEPQLSHRGFNYYSGIVENLTDVDLAIVSHSEKACLLLELKWFMAPTTGQERIHKSDEIKNGITQVLKLKQMFLDNYQPLLNVLNIDSTYRFAGVVVSENWIGYGNVQSSEVPVIRINHLIEKIKTTDSLRSTMDWLIDRKYLPKEGEHFTVSRPKKRIGNWYLKWYGIQDHCTNVFFPL